MLPKASTALEHSLGGRPLDYVVVNHMEPDHSASLAGVLRRWPKAQVVGNTKTIILNNVPDPLLRQPDHGGGLAVGGQTAQQIDARELEDGPAQPYPRGTDENQQNLSGDLPISARGGGRIMPGPHQAPRGGYVKPKNLKRTMGRLVGYLTRIPGWPPRWPSPQRRWSRPE